MKNRLVLSLSLFAVALSSCGGVHHNISEYVLSTNYHDNYRILQLTDLHLGDKDNQDLHYKFLDLTIRDADADFIVVTGDLFTFASKDTAKRLFAFLDSYEKPWTVTFGNHDEQCMFSVPNTSPCASRRAPLRQRTVCRKAHRRSRSRRLFYAPSSPASRSACG